MNNRVVLLGQCVEAFVQMSHVERRATITYLADAFRVFVKRCPETSPRGFRANEEDCRLPAGHDGPHEGELEHRWHDKDAPTEKKETTDD